jgi:pimeloyl-ACP methyl ester carboxylesterase
VEIEANPQDYGCKFEEVTFGPHGVHGYWLASNAAQTLIYHHGNGGNVGDNSEHACRLNKFGFNVLVFDYRGYGNSKGEFPSEHAVYQDAEVAWDFATQQKRIAPREIIIYGHSLGAAVAIEMARRHPNASGLISESGFTSVYEMAKRDKLFRFFPVRLIVHQEMDSISKLPQINMPVLIIHGARDKVVPADMAEELYAAANQPKQKLIVPAGGHDNTAAIGGDDYKRAVLGFAQTLSKQAAQK